MPSYSGLYNGVYGQPYAPITNATGNEETALARVTARRGYGRGAFRELIKALTGSAVGQTATAQHARVKAEQDLANNVQGGKRVIETHTSINRVTTAADLAAIDAALDLKSQPATYPKDRSGNGGGAKVGF